MRKPKVVHIGVKADGPSDGVTLCGLKRKFPGKALRSDRLCPLCAIAGINSNRMWVYKINLPKDWSVPAAPAAPGSTIKPAKAPRVGRKRRRA